MKFFEIFTPNGQPTTTYVSRNNSELEKMLGSYLETPNMLISISGPTKSGKTVLLKTVINEEYLIAISGSTIKTVDAFWNAIMSWMGAPLAETVTEIESYGIHGEAQVQGSMGAIFVKGKVSGSGGASCGSSTSTCKTVIIDPFIQVVKDIANSEYILFIDDFHYIPSETQMDIAKIIKGLAESGVKVCVASVPHRNEDVLTANPELRGRIASLQIPEWSQGELLQIATKGFNVLNIDVTSQILSDFSIECVGSPQLMQAICYNICLKLGITEPRLERQPIEFTQEIFESVLQNTTNFAVFKTTVDLFLQGPKVHGVERKQFQFTDESQGDVYRAILLAVKSDPPCRNFSYDDIISRVKSVCIDSVPTGSSISSSLSQLMEIGNKTVGEFSILEWDESYLTIIDPYFYFYLRNSKILNQL
jgi:Archaeal ATPase.